MNIRLDNIVLVLLLGTNLSVDSRKAEFQMKKRKKSPHCLNRALVLFSPQRPLARRSLIRVERLGKEKGGKKERRKEGKKDEWLIYEKRFGSI